jgi:hypothetical protein
MPYQEIAEVVGTTPAAVRQIAHRAREHVAARRPRMQVDRAQQQAAVDKFVAAISTGDVQGPVEVLAPDVVLISDGGGLAAARKPITGVEKVAAFLTRRAGTRWLLLPPAEAEARYHAEHVTDQPAGPQNPRVHETRDASRGDILPALFHVALGLSGGPIWQDRPAPFGPVVLSRPDRLCRPQRQGRHPAVTRHGSRRPAGLLPCTARPCGRLGRALPPWQTGSRKAGP